MTGIPQIRTSTSLTAAEVGRLSDALAVGLSELGVRHGDRVAVYLRNVLSS